MARGVRPAKMRTACSSAVAGAVGALGGAERSLIRSSRRTRISRPARCAWSLPEEIQPRTVLTLTLATVAAPLTERNSSRLSDRRSTVEARAASCSRSGSSSSRTMQRRISSTLVPYVREGSAVVRGACDVAGATGVTPDRRDDGDGTVVHRGTLAECPHKSTSSMLSFASRIRGRAYLVPRHSEFDRLIRSNSAASLRSRY